MPTTPHSPGTFCWFECGSRDAAAAKAFYTGLFGWTAEDRPMPGDMEGHYTMLRLDGKDVGGLYQLAGPMAEVPPHWATYVTVASVDDSAGRATSLGGTIAAPPMDVPGVGRIAFIQDPTGAMIGLFQLGEHPGSGVHGKVPGAFCWSELATDDVARADDFYRGLLGWTSKTDAGEPPYTEFLLGGAPVAGMMALTPQHGDAPPHWLPYVTVADCAAIAARVGELGGTVIVPPTEVPGVGSFTVFFDPGGAGLAVIEFPDGAS